MQFTNDDWTAWRQAMAATVKGELPPSPDDIAAGCLKIQRRWTDAERLARGTHYADRRRRAGLAATKRFVEVPVIATSEISPG